MNKSKLSNLEKQAGAVVDRRLAAMTADQLEALYQRIPAPEQAILQSMTVADLEALAAGDAGAVADYKRKMAETSG